MKVKRKIIEINEELCNGCGQCVVDCAESALEIIDGKARLIADKYCDGLGACMGGCPTGALTIVEKVCDDFDEEAVEELIRQKKQQAEQPCGCPSSQVRIIQPETPCQAANKPAGVSAAAGSALRHWPVQIRLVPPSAPFLQGADLLIAADCVPVSFAGFHQELLQGRVVMMGCPKFDDAQAYVQKLAEVFATAALGSITIAIMEVPCCGSMINIVKAALQQAGKEGEIETNVTVIGTNGAVIETRPL